MIEDPPAPSGCGGENARSNRLRAAADFPFNPTCMAVRRTGVGSPYPPLAAIAGPMGVTVVDVKTPQQPWLTLNYSTCPPGITTMAFQPCKSAYEVDGSADNVGSSSSSVLLATARGNSIMIWDCSGQELSPLLGRLVASDAGDSTASTLVDESDRAVQANDTAIPLPPNLGSPEEAAIKSLLSPSLVERKVSTNSALSNNSASNRQSAVPRQEPAVTSLDWKGPTEPILAATIGSSACCKCPLLFVSLLHTVLTSFLH